MKVVHQNTSIYVQKPKETPDTQQAPGSVRLAQCMKPSVVGFCTKGGQKAKKYVKLPDW